MSAGVEELILLRVLFRIVDSALLKFGSGKEHFIILCESIVLRLLRLRLR